MKERGEREGGREDEVGGREVARQRQGEARKMGGMGNEEEVSVEHLKYCL